MSLCGHPSATMNHHRRGPRQPVLPNLHLTIINSRDQRRISLTERSPIGKNLIEKLVFEKERESIEKGAARARSPGHEFAIGSAECEDRKNLKILGHRSRAPGDLRGPDEPVGPTVTCWLRRTTPPSVSTRASRKNSNSPWATTCRMEGTRKERRFPSTAMASRRLVLP